MKFKVKAGEEEGPSGLPAIQTLGRSEVLEVPVICPNVYLFMAQDGR